MDPRRKPRRKGLFSVAGLRLGRVELRLLLVVLAGVLYGCVEAL